MTTPQLALIGSGSVCHKHVPALEAVGMEVGAVASMNPESQTVEPFAEKHDIDQAFKGDRWREMLNQEWDGVVIATHVDGLAEALQSALELDVPVLVEKPVAWESEIIRSIAEQAHENVIVNYHRRYYRPVQKAKEFLDSNRPVMATLELPETDTALKPFIRKSCHGIDKLRFLFGDVTVLNSHELTEDGELRGFTASLRSEAGDLITVIANWLAPSNKGLSLDYQELRFQIEPYEQGRTYQGFDVKEPTDEMRFKQYVPKEITTINLDPIDRKYKPGFYNQAQSFKKLITERECHSTAATLDDATEVLRLMESMLPNRLPDEV